ARTILRITNRLLPGAGPGHPDPAPLRWVRGRRVQRPGRRPRGRPPHGGGDRLHRVLAAGALLRPLRDALRRRAHALGAQRQGADHPQVPPRQPRPPRLPGPPDGLAVARVQPQEGPLVAQLRRPRPAQAAGRLPRVALGHEPRRARGGLLPPVPGPDDRHRRRGVRWALRAGSPPRGRGRDRGGKRGVREGRRAVPRRLPAGGPLRGLDDGRARAARQRLRGHARPARRELHRGRMAQGEHRGVLPGPGEGSLPREQPPPPHDVLRADGAEGQGRKAVPPVREGPGPGVRRLPLPGDPPPLPEPPL
ncbi:MAG: hypothetical protein AVDCRST_MAG05-1775, partial [uncultured Rubrobacteraceae bacterium]